MLRAVVVGGAIAIALFIPVAWYWKIAIFLAIMFIVGLIGSAVQRNREMSN
jgi:membrane protein implicated in regulation of membrane protease activity